MSEQEQTPEVTPEETLTPPKAPSKRKNPYKDAAPKPDDERGVLTETVPGISFYIKA
jgi:hypothetical protein